MVKIKTSLINRKTLIIAVFILIFAVSIFAVFNHTRRTDNAVEEPNTINLDPPTKEDSQRVSDNKSRIVAQQEQEKLQPTNQSADQKKVVKPIITYAGQYDNNIEVGGYINDIFEDGGTCSATFNKGGLIVTKTVQAVKGSKSVDCPVMEASSAEFASKGEWSINITYTSSNAHGTSDSKNLEIK